MEQVIIIGQNYSTSLGIIRALGEGGFSCLVARSVSAISKRKSPEVASKYVSKYINLLKGENKDKENINKVISEFRGTSKRVILPADDYYAALLDEYSDQLEKHFCFPHIEGSGRIIEFMDKEVQKTLSREYGLKAAKCSSIHIEKGVTPVIPNDVEFPCIIKPLKSIGLPKSLIKRYNNADELCSTLNEIAQSQSCDLLIEEFIEIAKEYTIPGLSVTGEVYIPAFIRKSVVGQGDHKGVTIKGEVISSAPYQEQVSQMQQIIQRMHFEGVFDIELFETSKGFYLNEINLRNGAAGYALTAAGINIPALYVTSKQNSRPIDKEMEIKQGVTYVNDKALFENYLAHHCSFWSFVIDLLNSCYTHSVLSIRDPQPGFAFLRKIIYTQLRKLI